MDISHTYFLLLIKLGHTSICALSAARGSVLLLLSEAENKLHVVLIS